MKEGERIRTKKREEEMRRKKELKREGENDNYFRI